MRKSRLLTAAYSATLLFLTSTVNADLVITVTENTTLGGTNWAFSGGTGNVTGAGPHFLVGGTAANPQPFHSADDQDTDGLTVVAGTNTFGIQYIYVRNYSGLSGTNGDIYDGLDFQTQGTDIGGLSIGSLNGLVLHADTFDISSLNIGTNNMDSFYSGYGTELGTVTLLVGTAPPAVTQSVPAMSVWGLGILAGLLGIIGVRRKMI